jgi:hypothetical protein
MKLLTNQHKDRQKEPIPYEFINLLMNFFVILSLYFCALKGQCHQMVVEIMLWTIVDEASFKVCKHFFPFKNRSPQSYSP